MAEQKLTLALRLQKLHLPHVPLFAFRITAVYLATKPQVTPEIYTPKQQFVENEPLTFFPLNLCLSDEWAEVIFLQIALFSSFHMFASTKRSFFESFSRRDIGALVPGPPRKILLWSLSVNVRNE